MCETRFATGEGEEAGMSRFISHKRSCRRVRSLVAVGACAVGCLLPTSAAGAATAQSASLTMTSDQGDFIGDGRQYSYDTSAGDVFGSSGTRQTVNIDLRAANGDWWYLDFAAPAGQALVPMTYDSATRYLFQGPGAPGLSVAGNGRGCNTLTGSFTVTEVTFDPFGNLERFAADFEQHCEGAQPALRGHVQLVNPPAPAPLSVGLGLDATGTVDRVSASATVSGTLTCTRPAGVFLSGTLTQRASRYVVVTGRFGQQVDCSGSTPWRATVRGDGGVPFNPGSAQLDAHAHTWDEVTGQPVGATQSATVKLRR
jgi:hypothetical protein